MVNFIELVIALSIIVFVVPQSPTENENLVVRKLLKTGWFRNYAATKKLVIWLTWSLIFLFLLVVGILNC